MTKRYLLLTVALILIFCLTACRKGTYTQLTFSSADSEAVQAACEKTAEDFTGNKDIKFVKVISEDETDITLKNYIGDHVLKDDTYIYIVDPIYMYVCRIYPESSDAFDKLENSTHGKCTGEDAESQAKDIFNKALGKFFVSGSEISATYPEGTDNYTFTVDEKLGGIPTGNNAGILITETGIFWGGVFLKGDPGQINRIIEDKDKVLSFEAAENIALAKVKTDADLKAEDISIDETRLNEKGTYRGIPTWNVYIKFNNSQGNFIARVLVNIFSGDVETLMLAGV